MKTIRLTFLLIVALAAAKASYSQTWIWANDLNNDFDNNYYSSMQTDALGNSYYMYRYDETGYYGDVDLEYVPNLDGTPYFMVKHNSSGQMVWTKIINVSAPPPNGLVNLRMVVSSTGEVFLNGTVVNFAFGGPGIPFSIDGIELPAPTGIMNQGFLYKLDTDGTAVWGVEVQETANPGFGNTQGAFTSSFSADETTLFIAGPHSNDSLFFGSTGIKISEEPNPPTVSTLFVGEVDTEDGSLLWANGGFGGDEYNNIYAIETNDSDEIFLNIQWAGDICVIGDFEIPNPDNQGFTNADNLIAKFSSEGEPVWVDNIASSSLDYSAMALNSDGDPVIFGEIFEGIVVGGNALEAPGSYIAKYSFEGAVSSVQKVSNASAKQVVADGAGNFFIAGDFTEETLEIGDFELENAGGALGTSDIVIANVTETGEVLDAMRMGGMDSEVTQLMDLTGQNQIVLSGTYNSLELPLDDVVLENENFPGVKGFVAGMDYPLSIVNASESVELIRPFPNPANDFIAFNSSEYLSGMVQIDVIDMQGRVVAQENMTLAQSNRLDVSDLENGIYFLNYELNGQHFAGKFVVNR